MTRQSKGPHLSDEGLLNGSDRCNMLGGGYNTPHQPLRSVGLVWRGFVAGLGLGHDQKAVIAWQNRGIEYLDQDEAGQGALDL